MKGRYTVCMATATDVKTLDSKMFVAVNTADNNNKFWKYEHLSSPVTETNNKGKAETGDTRITWGRVGAAHPDQQLIMWDLKAVSSKIADKTDTNSKEVYSRMASGQGLEGLTRKGKRDDYYTEVKTIGNFQSSPPVTAIQAGQKLANDQVRKLAVAEIAGGCAITAALVKKLAETNRHELVAATSKDGLGVSGGGMDIDLETGMVKTPLGVLTLDSIKEGRLILDQMLPFVQKRNTDTRPYINLFDQYLRCIPQFIGYKRGAHVDFINITAQNSLLDQLETSVDLALQRMRDAEAAAKAPNTPAAVKQQNFFECKLALVNDQIIWERVKKEFFATVNRGHSCSHLKPVRVYEVTIPHMVQAFDLDGKKVGNVRELWHGTRVFNILSILKRGFMLPTQLTTAQTTGAMYDNGVYFSNQSTKSLNYSFGYWGGGGIGRDNNCYMFRVDVAMGKPYTPYGPDGRAASYCKKNGFDSCWAKAGVSGIQNDEQIVYRTSQSNIRYLVEFNDR